MGDLLTIPESLDQKPNYVADIATLSNMRRGNVTSVHVQGPRGGNFNFSTTGVPNGGTVFAASGGGYWVRQAGSFVLPEHFGELTSAAATTSAILAAATYASSAGRTLQLADSLYTVNPIQFTFPVKIQLGENTTVRLVNSAPLQGNDLWVFKFLAPNSSLIGGQVDFNRTGQDKAAFNSAGGGNTQRYFSVWATGTANAPLTNISINTRIINSADIGLRLNYVNNSNIISSTVATSGAGLQATYCNQLSITNLTLTNLDNDAWRVFPHALDVFNCSYVTGSNIVSTGQNGDDSLGGSTSLSDWNSGFTCVASDHLTFSNFSFSFAKDATQNKSVGISFLNVRNSDFSQFKTTCFTDTGLELGSVTDCNFSNYQLDGEYAICNNSGVSSTGMSLYNHGYYPDFNSRTIRQSTDNNFTNGKHIRCLNVGLNGQTYSRNTFTKVDFCGNYVGANLDYFNNDQTIVGAVVQKNSENKFIACRFNFNERAGVIFLAGTDTRFFTCEKKNNGQAKTNTSGAYRFTGRGTIGALATGGFITTTSVTVGTERVRTRLEGLVAYDDQTTITAVGSASSTGLRSVSVENPGLYNFGQTIKLIGAGVSGVDLTAQVLDINADELTLDRNINTFPLAGGTGTISTSGVNITGSATAFDAQITGRFWIVAGGVYRQVIKVNSATSAQLASAFPSNLSGASFQIVRFQVQQIRSQEYGINLSSNADNGIYITSPDFTGGNLTSNFSTLASGVFTWQDASYGMALTYDRGPLSFGGYYGLQIRHPKPFVLLSKDDAPADNRQWFFSLDNQELSFSLRNDAGTETNKAIRWLRSGAKATGFVIQSPLLLRANDGNAALALTVNSSSPSVGNSSYCKTANTASTSIVTLTGGSEGQILIILFTDSNTTLVHATGGTADTIKLRSGANVTFSANQTASFIRGPQYWHQTN